MWLYNFIFILVRILLKAKNPVGIKDIWCRNSLKFNNIVFGKSDIDFTILLNRNMYYEKSQRQFLKLKNFFPILGEVNVYSLTDLENLAGFFNFDELARDPMLLASFPLLGAPVTQTTKLVFLLKMMRADKLNLTHHFKMRKKKWDFHFSQLGLGESPNNLKQMLERLEAEFGVPLKYLEMNLSLHTYIPLSDYGDSQYLKLFPVDWLYHSLLNLKFEQHLHCIEELSTADSELLLAQLAWELMGLTGQYRNIKEQTQFCNHLDNMLIVLGHLRHDQAPALAARLQNLKVHYLQTY